MNLTNLGKDREYHIEFTFPEIKQENLKTGI